VLWSLVLPLSLLLAGAKGPPKGGGGFGAAKPPPPTLDEVCAGFKTRLPKDTAACCPCGSGAAYEACCRPYHRGEAVAESPERCLRSRYSGFAYRLPRYIIDTTDRSNPDWMSDKVKWAKKLDKEQMFDTFRFDGLEIGESEAGATDRESFLSLLLKLTPIDKRSKLPTQAEPMVFSERSKFVQNAKGAWLYAAGDVTTETSGLRGRVLKSEKDLAKVKKDVDFVRGILKEKPTEPEE